MNCDVKSYELAEHFLSDEPHLDTDANRRALAEAIQAAVEDWFSITSQNNDEKSAPGDDNGAMWITREKDGYATIVVRSPGSPHESRISMPWEKWNAMRDAGQ